MPKKPITTDLERAKWLTPQLRRISRMWPPANEALDRAKVAPGRFRCAGCEDVFKRDEVHRDHIEPVVPVTGTASTQDLISRLFCFADGYQILCEGCHGLKSQQENTERRQWKKSKKF